MDRTETDILVVGAGAAGAIATAAFAHAGFDTLCVDPVAPVTDGGAEGADLRTTALLTPARDLLERIGVWHRLAPGAVPLRVMRMVDASGPDGAVRVSRDFDAADLGQEAFGWNVPNWRLRATLAGHLADLPGATLRYGAGIADILPRLDRAIVRLTDGTRIDARLVVAADGRDSPTRAALGIGARTRRFGQKALSFAVTHDAPHDGISTEIHRGGGPFTLVPLPDHEGRPCSGIVWMEDGTEAMRLADLDVARFEATATERSAGLYGPLTLVTRRQVWPIVTRRADRMTARRTALIAEAAHAMPPIGAQGLNTSIADIRVLRDLAAAAPRDIGSRAMLDAYARAREGDVTMRGAGISALNIVSQSGHPAVQAVRSAGIAALCDIAPLRRRVMRMGLGE